MDVNEENRKKWRLAVVVVGVVLLLVFVYVLRMVVFPFLLGLAFAYVLLPAVKWLERHMPGGMKARSSGRVSAIAIIYVLIIALSGVFLFYTIGVVAHTVDLLSTNSSVYLESAKSTLKDWTGALRAVVPEGIRSNMDQYVDIGANSLVGMGNKAAAAALSSVGANVGVILGLAAVPYFLYYVLKDHDKIQPTLYSGLPVWASVHTRSIVSILENSFGTYIRSAFTLSAMVGAFDFLGFLVFRVPLAPLLGVVAALCELVPVIGSWLGGIIAVVVTLALAPDKAILVLLVVAAAQLVENLVLAPRIQSAYFHINPALTILLLVVGGSLAGAWGVVLAMPLASAALGIYSYCCRVLMPEQDVSRQPVTGPSE